MTKLPEDFPRPMLNSVPKGEYSGVSAILTNLGGSRKFYRGVPSFLVEPEPPLVEPDDNTTAEIWAICAENPLLKRKGA